MVLSVPTSERVNILSESMVINILHSRRSTIEFDDRSCGKEWPFYFIARLLSPKQSKPPQIVANQSLSCDAVTVFSYVVFDKN